MTDIENADALIVPEKDYREGFEFLFHHKTTDLFDFLSKEFKDQLKVEICANDEEYVEIALHSNTLRISKILVTGVVAPLLVGLLTDYVYDYVKAKPTDTVEMALVIEKPDGRGVKLTYKGVAKDFHLVSDKVKELVEVEPEKKKASPKKKLPK